MNHASARMRSYKPQLEALEDRLNPATFFPTTPDQLAAVLLTAGSNQEADVIDLGEQTFTLTSSLSNVEADGGNALIIQNGTIQRASTAGNFRILTVAPGANLTLDGVTLRAGKVNDAGGGIFNSGSLTLKNSTLSGNNAETGQGGAIHNAGTIVLITNSTISGNDADTGGGISNAGHIVAISNSTFSINDAKLGGGIASTGTIQAITNSTFSGNAATVGGGIHSSNTITLLANNTIAHNIAAQNGGGISNTGTIQTLSSTLLANNEAGGVGIDLHSGAIANAKHNLIETVSGHGIANGSNGNIVGIDPKLGGLANNGGPVLTHALLGSSPAIDAGNNDQGLGYDQRGYDSRTINGVADIGAFETGAVAPPVTEQTVTDLFAVGIDGGARGNVDPRVKVYNADGSLRFDLLVYENQFRGGARVATADVNHDGVEDIITGAGVGGGPRVRVFDGATGNPLDGLLGSFYAFDEGNRSGIFVAGGDVNGDGYADVIVTQDAGGAAEVRIFSGANGSLLANYAIGDGEYAGGYRVAAGNVTGDRRAEVIIVPGSETASTVSVYEGGSGTFLGSFAAFDSTYAGGAHLATGDLNGDGFAEILTGTGSGGLGTINIFDFRERKMTSTFAAFEPSENTADGIRIATVDTDADGELEILAVKASSSSPGVKVLNGITFAELDLVFTFDPPTSSSPLGEYVG